MTVWIMAAQGKSALESQRGYCGNEVRVGIYIDQRTLWVETPKKNVFGKPSKTRRSSSREATRQTTFSSESCILTRESGQQPRSVCSCGYGNGTLSRARSKRKSRVTYNFTAYKQRPADPKQWVKMHARLDRIRRLAAETKIAKAAWVISPWRSRALLWHALGYDIDPEFALNTNSVRHEAWKARGKARSRDSGKQRLKDSGGRSRSRRTR